MYGNEQAQYTMYRASYGANAANMMMGANTIYGGAYNGINNMLSDVGGMVMPVGYAPPARVNVGFYGQYPQSTGFFSTMGGMMGFGGPSRSQMAADYMQNIGSDFGERIGGGAVGLGTSVAGMGVGSIMGRFLGGGIVGSLAGGLVGSMAAGAVMDSVGQRREINNFLEQSSFRYVGAGSAMADPRRGGMSMGARAQATDMIRKMDFADPFMSTEDLTMILQQGTQKGMFTGVQDMSDFKKKFKDLTDTVKVVTRTLGQTLDEAMSTIKELKTIGIDPAQARGVISSADSLGRMAGRTGAEMLNIGLQGAEMFRGTGVNMGIGAQASMMNLASVRAARDAGMLSTEAVAQAGGEEALALRMNASGLAFGQSTLGRGFGAAFFNPSMGMAGFNQGAFMSQLMGGGMSLTGMAMQAAGNLGSLPNLIAYQANQEKFMTEAGKTFGGKGLQMMQTGVGMAQAQFLSQQTGAKFEDSYRLSLKQMGMSQSEIEANIAEARGSKEIFKSANEAANTAYNRAVVESSYRNNVFVQAGSKIRDIGKAAIDPWAASIEGVIDSTKAGAMSFIEEQMYGVRRGGSSSIQVDLGGKVKEGVVNLDKGGWLASTSGERIAKNIKKLGGKTREITDVKDLKPGEVILDEGPLGMGSMTVANLSEEIEKSKNFNVSQAEVDAASKKMTASDKDKMLMQVYNAKASTSEEVVNALFGSETATKEQIAQASAALSGSVYGKLLEEKISGAQGLAGTGDSVDVEKMITAGENLDSSLRSIRRKIATSVAGRAILDVSKISDNTIGLMSLAQKDPGSPEQIAAMEKAKAAFMRETGASKKATDLAFQADFGADNAKLADNQATLNAAREKAGATKLSAALVASADILTDKDQHTQVMNAAVQLGKSKTVADLSKAVKIGGKGLENTGVGRMIIQAEDVLKDIEAGKATTEDILKAGLGETLAKDYASAKRGEKSFASVAEAGLSELKQSFQGKEAVLGDASAIEAGGVTPGQTLAQQVNINTQILQVMSGLAQKLGVK